MGRVLDRGIVFAFVIWCVISVLTFVSRLLVFVAVPLAALAVIFLAPRAADIRRVLRQRRPMAPRSRTLTALLAALVCASLGGAIASMLPSMAFRYKSGQIAYEYAISVLAAPALWACIFIVATRALVMMSPRRLAMTAMATLAAWPALVAIRALREPWFDIDSQFVLVTPWIIHVYVACAIIASGIAVVLAYRLPGATVETESPPLAIVLVK